MDQIIGPSVPVFVGLTLVLFGGAAFLAGRSVAAAWKSPGRAAVYAALLGLGDRFLTWGLFKGELLSLGGYVSHAIILALIALVSFRLTQARKMTSQYPWLYERVGPFSWRQRA